VSYGVLDTPAERRAVDASVLESRLTAIQSLWNTDFSQHMDAKANQEFPGVLSSIRALYTQAKYGEAAAVAHEHYEWALLKTDFCEILTPGFSYFSMRDQFASLEQFINKANAPASA